MDAVVAPPSPKFSPFPLDNMAKCQPLPTYDGKQTFESMYNQYIKDEKQYKDCMVIHNGLVDMIEDRISGKR